MKAGAPPGAVGVRCSTIRDQRYTPAGWRMFAPPVSLRWMPVHGRIHSLLGDTGATGADNPRAEGAITMSRPIVAPKLHQEAGR